MSDIYGFDAFAPKDISERVKNIGVAKAGLPWLSVLMLGVLAGAFIGLGGLYYVIVKSDPLLSFAASQLLGGLVFCLGLLLVVVAGAELFTGNNLLVMAWAERHITTKQLLKNWLLVCLGNFIGASALACLVFISGHTEMNQGLIGETYLKIGVIKCSMPLWQAFFKGILCNVLVCLAVWMAFAGRSVVDKAVAIVFPISAFVAAGFEHSIANMYFIPLAMLEKYAAGQGDATMQALSWAGFLHNLMPVILGNIIGGGVLVALVYHIIYRRKAVLAPGKE
ncbi:formate/nitrite transporter family protein [Thalassomonas actiniarum]|uniref:Formate/nitrite transporter family protein n=2 Tax=Thalassomonas actiniarum TaxID=485447 RepID=A0AAE9YWN1_9GAMM|nr:formate/nitrite transporter family protein [Thalassomonas actiniarum]